MKKKNNKGFSLIELIIAIAILVILTGLLAPQFMKYIEKSREAKDMQTLDTVYNAVQGALADEAAYKDLTQNMDVTYKGLDEGLSFATLLGNNEGFAKELKTILGSGNNLKLSSVKSTEKLTGGKTTTQGEVCIKIVYTEDTETEPGGLAVTVFCGKDGKKVGTLDDIGASLAE